MYDLLRFAAVASLTDRGRDLLQEIEEFAGLSIKFAPYTFEPRPNTVNPDAPATSISHDGATIYVHGREQRHLLGLPHELLHIHRVWCEGVPQLLPVMNYADNVSAASEVENTLEHLVIVPREAQYGLDASDLWQKIARAKWERYPWPDITNANARRKNALLGKLENELAPNIEINAIANKALQAEGLLHEAELFAKRIKKLLSNKPQTAACAVRFLKWPKDQLHLVYMDIRKRARRTEPLPDQ